MTSSWVLAVASARLVCSRYGNGVFASIDYAAFSRLKMHYDIFFSKLYGYFHRFTGFRVKNTKRTLFNFCNLNTNIIFAYLHVHQWTDPLLVLVVVYCPFDTNRLPHIALTYIILWKYNRGADISFRKIQFFKCPQRSVHVIKTWIWLPCRAVSNSVLLLRICEKMAFAITHNRNILLD